MRKLRVAVIGAGAISQQWHIPIIAGHEKMQLSALVEPNAELRHSIAESYGASNSCSDFREVSVSDIDLVVIATPSAFHFQIARYFLEHNVHALVEKPLATSFSESLRLVEIAEQRGLVLACGLYRRLYPSLRVLKQLVEGQDFGRVLRFSFDWGSFYNWGAVSLGSMTSEAAGGGVLFDLGPHVFDWLTFIFGDDARVTRYVDDNLGGVEADAQIDLLFSGQNADVPGTVRLSRIRELGGEICIEFESAFAILGVGERFNVKLIPKPKGGGEFAELQYLVALRSEAQTNWFEAFRAEFDDVIDSIEGRTQPVLSGHSTLSGARILDACMDVRSVASMPWVDDTISCFSSNDLAGRRVLVTGASGFIGCRICEAIALTTSLDVVAGVNSPGNAARLSRLPVTLVRLNLTDASSIDRAIDGCDIVIHCAVGTSYGDERALKDVTVEGTRRLVSSAQRHHIKRFVFLSSLAVTDVDAISSTASEINESSPVLRGEAKSSYSAYKAQAESIVLDACAKGLPAMILRPSNVYGAFAPLLRVGALGQMLGGKRVVMTEDTANSPLNAVYVDNLVEAVFCCLKASAERIERPVYVVNDEDASTYREFYEFFSKRFGCRVSIEDNAPSEDSGGANQSVSFEIRAILRSPYLKRWLKTIYFSPRVGWGARFIMRKFPVLENKFRDNSPVIYVRDAKREAALVHVSAFTSLPVRSERLSKDLGYKRVVQRDQALDLTAAWVVSSMLDGRCDDFGKD